MSKNYLAEGNTKEVTIEGQKIVLKKFSYSVQKQIMELSDADKKNDSMDFFLLSSLKSWSLTCEDGSPLPLTGESLNVLSADFVTVLIKACTEFNNVASEEQKNS